MVPLITPALGANTIFNDLPVADGTFYYRIRTTNAAGTMSALSNLASAASDRTPPDLAAISYTPENPNTLKGGRFGARHRHGDRHAER
ncbi:MAG: hypothetical protein R3F11_18430 [Verrucomicrobiales bacterium]